MVVFLHASGLSGRQWSRWLPHFAGAIAPDRRSIAREGESQLQIDLAELLALLDTLPPVHLVGHSYGGVLALKAALLRDVLSVAVYEPPILSILRTGTREDRTLLERSQHPSLTDPATAGSPAWIERFVDWWNGDGAFAALPQPSRAELTRTAPDAAREVLALAADATSLSDLAALRADVLSLTGSRPPAPVASALRSLESLPRVRAHTLPDAGHMAPLTAYDRLIPLVRAFHQDVATGSGPSAGSAASPR